MFLDSLDSAKRYSNTCRLSKPNKKYILSSDNAVTPEKPRTFKKRKQNLIDKRNASKLNSNYLLENGDDGSETYSETNSEVESVKEVQLYKKTFESQKVVDKIHADRQNQKPFPSHSMAMLKKIKKRYNAIESDESEEEYREFKKISKPKTVCNNMIKNSTQEQTTKEISDNPKLFIKMNGAKQDISKNQMETNSLELHSCIESDVEPLSNMIDGYKCNNKKPVKICQACSVEISSDDETENDESDVEVLKVTYLNYSF